MASPDLPSKTIHPWNCFCTEVNDSLDLRVALFRLRRGQRGDPLPHARIAGKFLRARGTNLRAADGRIDAACFAPGAQFGALTAIMRHVKRIVGSLPLIDS